MKASVPNGHITADTLSTNGIFLEDALKRVHSM